MDFRVTVRRIEPEPHCGAGYWVATVEVGTKENPRSHSTEGATPHAALAQLALYWAVADALNVY